MGYFKHIDRWGNELAPLDFNPTGVTYTPTPSGNTTNLNSFVVDPSGDMYFIDKDGESFKINTSNPLDVLAGVQPTPTATGNTTNLNSVFKDANGDTWIVDYKGDGIKVASAAVAETVTTITDTVTTGHLIGSYTNEAGVTVDINETLTVLNTFSISGNTITLEYTAEDGAKTTKTVDVPADVITTLTNALTAGNKIGTYTNESATAVDIYETVTSVTDFSIAGSTITLKYKDETGTENTKSFDLPAAVAETVTTLTNALTSGNKIGTYTNESAVVVDIYETVTALANVIATGHKIGDYTNESGVNVVLNETITSVSDLSIAGNVITLKYIDETGTENTKNVTVPDDVLTSITDTVLIGGNKIGTYTDEAGATTDINESLTTTADYVPTGHKIAEYINEAQVITVINETVTTLVDNGDDTYTYTNENGVTTTLTISAAGAPVTVGLNPPTGASIEGAIHLVTDDGTPIGTVLEQYIYDVESGTWIEMQRNAQDILKFGTVAPTANGEWDGEEYFVTSTGTSAGTITEQWIWDKQSSTWVKRPSATAPIEQYEKTTATALQTSYTLSSVPVGRVQVTRNGVEISGSWSWVGAVGTYTPADNFGCTIDANDLLQFSYESY